MNLVQYTAQEKIGQLGLDPANRCRALIVDDNEIDRRRLKNFCDRSGLDIDFVDAASIAQMREVLKDNVFDLIFIDYRLDDGDGLRALEVIKRNAKNCFAATIMVAGVAQTQVAVTALKAGCSDYILKDQLDPEWLKRAVINALEKSQLRRGMDASEQIRETLRVVLNGFTQEVTQEMKPMLSRMMRELRRARGSAQGNRVSMSLDELTGLEETCSALWDFAKNVEKSCNRYL